MYYEPLGAWYMGRIENATHDNRGLEPRPYGLDQNQRDLSPKSDRLRTDDIDGASPNAYGRARYLQGKDYMNIQDIPGAKPRYRELIERR